jgi:catechol 2,3-dioxygenase-like lactoylglutathione lyase family enzyme
MGTLRAIRNNEPTTNASAARVDMKLEVVVIPVSDVDRAKEFYARLGWRLDADFTAGDDWRGVQFTPPGSGCSVIFGKNVTKAAPGLLRACTWPSPTLRPPGTICSVAALK